MTPTNNARPSLLAGDRDALNQPERVAEKLSLVAFKWLKPLIPANYRAITASNVAQAMVSAMQTAGAGRYVLRRVICKRRLMRSAIGGCKTLNYTVPF